MKEKQKRIVLKKETDEELGTEATLEVWPPKKVKYNGVRFHKFSKGKEVAEIFVSNFELTQVLKEMLDFLSIE